MNMPMVVVMELPGTSMSRQPAQTNLLASSSVMPYFFMKFMYDFSERKAGMPRPVRTSFIALRISSGGVPSCTLRLSVCCGV